VALAKPEEVDETLARIKRGAETLRMQVAQVEYVRLDPGQVTEVFHRRLQELAGLGSTSAFLRRVGLESGEKPGWYTTVDMQGRGSDIDVWLAEPDDPRFEVVRLARALSEALTRANIK
jgi:hypothetical protein